VNSINTGIIPSQTIFTGAGKSIDYKAICIFAALGFFLDQDTYWTEQKALPPASICHLDDAGNLISSKRYFHWHYDPRILSLDDATDEFTGLYESIIRGQIKKRKVILPLSGGLDSRTQASALKNIGADVHAYSYSFDGGHDETEYSEQIARAQDFQFEQWKIEKGYLWQVIDHLAQINGCYTEFTHPRQMAFFERYQNLGEVFSLGHWGDVLFDDMGVTDQMPFDEQVKVILKKIIKKSGSELADALWKAWGVEGNFSDYFEERVRELLSGIDISDNANARIRAFKSMYWAPRWTSVNLSIFRKVTEVTLPFYDNRMCEFICTIPERHLSGRQIQIEYLKRRAPRLAKIIWQEHRPFNLYNYRRNKTPWNLPYRVIDKAKRSLSKGKYVQRNWELQFLGDVNNGQLKSRLFDEASLIDWIPREILQKFYRKFTSEDMVYYSHSISMLLTLSLFSRHFKKP
jgi:asparagine synthetase B (glutamine-hydrolysing)